MRTNATVRRSVSRSQGTANEETPAHKGPLSQIQPKYSNVNQLTTRWCGRLRVGPHQRVVSWTEGT